MNAATQKPVPTTDYEFPTLELAANYRNALLAEFRPRLRGRVLEAGAGIGQFTALLLREAGIERFVASEPDPRFVERLRGQFPLLELIAGTIDAVPTALTPPPYAFSTALFFHCSTRSNRACCAQRSARA